MTQHQKKLIRRTTLALATVGLLIPVTVSPSQSVDINDACANGSCCRELNSVCLKDGTSNLHHYQATGACTTKR